MGGGGGQHYKPSIVGGRVDCEIKIWQGGGVAEEMTGLPKNCPAPPPLINNDRRLQECESKLFAFHQNGKISITLALGPLKMDFCCIIENLASN